MRHPAVNRSRPRAWPRRYAAGFTLLELLVVVVIIAITISLAVIGIGPDRDEELETEARRFAALINLASQEAIVQSRELAAMVDRHGYRFLILDGEDWTAIGDDALLRERKLPEAMSLAITYDGEAVDLAREEDAQGARIYLLSSGEITPFEVTFAHEQTETRFHVRGIINGKLTTGHE